MSGLEWNRKFALEQTAGDEELLAELLDLFKDSSAGDFEALRNGLQADDPAAVAVAAHSIKGAAASLGLESIRALSWSVEADARAGSLAAAREHLDELEALLREASQLS